MSALNDVELFESGLSSRQLRDLARTFPASHFERLQQRNFRFYRTTFWLPLDRRPQNVFESAIIRLKELATPSAQVIGVEWWFSVLLTNATPQWILPYHFDRNDLYLHHGVIGRMWRPVRKTRLRVTMAVNWWREKPKAAYLHDSGECLAAFGLPYDGGMHRRTGFSPSRTSGSARKVVTLRA